MKLGVNTHFIMKFPFEEGLEFCQAIGVKAMELAAMGPNAGKYCDVERLLNDDGGRTSTRVTTSRSIRSVVTARRWRRTSRLWSNSHASIGRRAR